MSQVATTGVRWATLPLSSAMARDVGFVDSYCRMFAVDREGFVRWEVTLSGLPERYLEVVRDCVFSFGLVHRPWPTKQASQLDDLARWFQVAAQAIEDSPLPDNEWGGLTDALGELLPGLVGVSASSVSRYRSGSRPTPDAVAARLHTVALIVTDLAGSYNDFGIRRWFTRPRAALGGKRPADVLSGDWDPDSEQVQRVRRLSGWLTGQVSDDPVPAR